MEKNPVEEELINRIELIESPDYEGAKRFSRKDYIATAIIAVVCLAIVIAGAFL